MSQDQPEPNIRAAAVAGRFYPAEPCQLRRMVNSFIDQADGTDNQNAKAIIAPHAGYTYSGPVAGSAFRLWAEESSGIKRVVLVGPSHWIDFDGVALPNTEAFATPLGEVPLDLDTVRKIRPLQQVKIFNAAHEREHCLEVELPFLQTILPDFTILPLVLGEVSDAKIQEVVDVVWGGPETRIVISSDLSHYHSYERARSIDGRTACAIERLDSDALSAQRACGYRAIQALLRAASARELRATTIDLQNSGDTGGPRDRVVGYGAFAFMKPAC